MPLRKEVLQLYRRLIRLSYKWESALGNPGSTEEEKKYIKTETRRLFRKNKDVRSFLLVWFAVELFFGQTETLNIILDSNEIVSATIMSA